MISFTSERVGDIIFQRFCFRCVLIQKKKRIDCFQIVLCLSFFFYPFQGKQIRIKFSNFSRKFPSKTSKIEAMMFAETTASRTSKPRAFRLLADNIVTMTTSISSHVKEHIRIFTASSKDIVFMNGRISCSLSISTL